MKTKVFISWSGNLSKRIAECLRGWLPSVLQHVTPYFSPDDIEKGTKWDTEISKKLEESDIGIICVTRENVDRPWILFEAGAISKHVSSSNVCPIYLDLKPTDTDGPLSRFQGTQLTKEDFKRLVGTINNAAHDESKLDKDVLNAVFEKWWSDFQEKFEKLLSDKQEVVRTKPIREDREILEEILKLCRETRKFQDKDSSTYLHPEFSENRITINNALLEKIAQLNDEELHRLNRMISIRPYTNTKNIISKSKGILDCAKLDDHGEGF